MKNKYLALLAKQEKELNCLMEYGERKLLRLQTERDNELKANEIHRNELEKKLKNPKVVKKPRVQIQPSLRPRTACSQVTGIVSSRTRAQFANFKKGPDEKTRLEVKIGDVRKITKPLTPISRKNEKTFASPMS